MEEGKKIILLYKIVSQHLSVDGIFNIILSYLEKNLWEYNTISTRSKWDWGSHDLDEPKWNLGRAIKDEENGTRSAILTFNWICDSDYAFTVDKNYQGDILLLFRMGALVEISAIDKSQQSEVVKLLQLAIDFKPSLDIR
jgi:hypothetical protein